MRYVRIGLSITGVLLFLLNPAAHSSLLYKNYVIIKDRGHDILCDPYTVRKNDWVLKVFRQKGEIAHKDFPLFLTIFKRINPQIKDVNTIRPGEQIYIPLRRIKPDSMPGQETGVVTIPFVTLSDAAPKIDTQHLQKEAKSYTIKRGDTVSKLISKHFAKYGTKSYKEGLALFKAMNPNIKNLNLIFAGDSIYLPQPQMQQQQWYKPLVDKDDSPAQLSADAPRPRDIPRMPEERIKKAPPAPQTPLARAAQTLGATLLDRGTYYLPRPGQNDLKLNLKVSPVMELGDGQRLVFPNTTRTKSAHLQQIQTYWNAADIIPITAATTTEQILDAVLQRNQTEDTPKSVSFSEQGVVVNVQSQWIKTETDPSDNSLRYICISMIDEPAQRTPESIVRYLEQHGIVLKDTLKSRPVASSAPTAPQKTYPVIDVATLDASDAKGIVKALLAQAGYPYSQKVAISFPYAGMQIEAVSNLVLKPDGSSLLVDFGELYGDAPAAIEKTGLKVIRILPTDSFTVIFEKLFKTIGATYTRNPTFFAAKRPAHINTSIMIPGFLLTTGAKKQLLIAATPIQYEVIRFFRQKQISIVQIKNAAG